MGSRGKWSLLRVFGGLTLLLRWWAATSPVFLARFSSAIKIKQDSEVSSELREELRAILAVPGKELNAAISRRLDNISRLRRKMLAIITNAFDDLVETAKLGQLDQEHA